MSYTPSVGMLRPVTFAVVAACAAGPVASCLNPTELVVDLHTNVAPATVRSRGVLIRVGSPASVDTAPSTTFTTSTCGDDGEIGRFVIVPSGSFDDAVSMHVLLGVGDATDACADQSGTSCITARRQLAFSPHARLLLPIELDASCLGVDCGPTGTCVDGQCTDDNIDTNDCDGGTCLPPADGGASDAHPDVTLVGDGGPTDAQNDAPCSTQCGGTCVDFQSDPQNCGACGVDCTGGTCTAGVCTVNAQVVGSCLAVQNGKVYVATATGLAEMSSSGGPYTTLGSQPVTSVAATASNVAYYVHDANSSALYDLALANPYVESATSTASVMALSDLYAYAWLDFSDGGVWRQTYKGQTTTGSITSLGKLLGGGGIALAQDVVYATDSANVWRIVDSNTVVKAALPGSGAVVVDDPDKASPHVLVASQGIVIGYDSQLKSSAPLVSSPVTNPPPLAAIVNDASSQPNRVFALAGTNSTWTQILVGPWGGDFAPLGATTDAAPKCIAIDDTAVYWLEKAGGVFKRPKSP